MHAYIYIYIYIHTYIYIYRERERAIEGLKMLSYTIRVTVYIKLQSHIPRLHVVGWCLGQILLSAGGCI